MKSSIFRLCVLTLLAILFSGAALAEKTDWPEVTPEGLHRVTFSEFAVVYKTSGADLSGYKRIKLLNPLVRFRRNWEGKDAELAELNGVEASAEIQKTIRVRLSRLFRKVFVEKLESAGYEVVTENQIDVLVIRPAIINLKVIASEGMDLEDTEVIIRSAGEATLFIEVFDSVTGELLAKALDRKISMDKPSVSADFMYIWGASDVTQNVALIDQAFTAWADSLVAALDRAKSN